MNNESLVKSGNSTYEANANLQATSAVAITSSDTTTYSPSTLYVGVTGNLNVVTVQGQTTLFTNVPVGFFPVLVTKVMASSTTASGLVLLS